MAVLRNPILRRLVFLAGCIFLAAGVIFLFVPLLPTTPFLILATWCFFRSSPRAHRWLLRNPYFGPSIRLWQERGAIGVKSKIFACLAIVTSIGIIWFLIQIKWIAALITIFLTAMIVFIASRPSN